MKSSLLRIALLLTVLVVAAAALPVFADDVPAADPAAPAAPSMCAPWWEVCPPVPPKPKTRTRTVVRTAETTVESIPAEGYCYTAIKKVNVRSQPSIYATKVATVKSAGTEFIVSARAKNSAGEIWYAVKLANGTLGYIRSDLVNTDHVILLGDPYGYEDQEETKTVPASESASDTLKIVTDRVVKDPNPTPQVIFINREEAAPQATPTPIIVYVTPAPQAEVTPQIIYIYEDKDIG